MEVQIMVARVILSGLVVALSACGQEAYQPVPWEGQAANSLLGDEADDVGGGADGGDVCRLDVGGGCGGGGGDDVDAPEEPSPPEPPPEEPPVAPPDPDGWSAASAALEDEMLRLVNEFRQNGGNCPSGAYGPRAPLTMDPALRSAARHHSKDMADAGYFSHTSRDGRSPWQRMSDAGYDGQPSGENIAAGNQSAAATFEQWRNSDGHCRNMMTTNANEIGVGYAAGGSYGSYWTQTFGAG